MARSYYIVIIIIIIIIIISAGFVCYFEVQFSFNPAFAVTSISVYLLLRNCVKCLRNNVLFCAIVINSFLIDWLVGCLVDGWMDWFKLIDWLIDWLFDWLIGWLINWLILWSCLMKSVVNMSLQITEADSTRSKDCHHLLCLLCSRRHVGTHHNHLCPASTGQIWCAQYSRFVVYYAMVTCETKLLPSVVAQWRALDVFSSICLFVCLFVGLFVCQHDNFWTSKHRMMKLGG